MYVCLSHSRSLLSKRVLVRSVDQTPDHVCSVSLGERRAAPTCHLVLRSNIQDLNAESIMSSPPSMYWTMPGETTDQPGVQPNTSGTDQEYRDNSQGRESKKRIFCVRFTDTRGFD